MNTNWSKLVIILMVICFVFLLIFSRFLDAKNIFHPNPDEITDPVGEETEGSAPENDTTGETKAPDSTDGRGDSEAGDPDDGTRPNQSNPTKPNSSTPETDPSVTDPTAPPDTEPTEDDQPGNSTDIWETDEF